MGHLHMRRQVLQSTKVKPPDTDWEEKIKTNDVFCTTVGPSTTKEGNIYSDPRGRLPTTSSRGRKYIYVMYMYDCNTILTTATNNRSGNEMIQSFTYSTEDLKRRGLNPGFHFMDNKASAVLKMKMTSMNIKYQLVAPSNHRSNNLERSIQTFKNHLILGLCSIECFFTYNCGIDYYNSQ